MSGQAKEVAQDLDSSMAAVTNDVGMTKLVDVNGTAQGGLINGAKSAEADQETGESNLQVENGDHIKSQGDSKKDFNERKENTRNQYLKRQNKSKFDPTSRTISEDAAARAESIRNQVDFYFSDSNLPDDKYLMGLTDGANNLPVKISVIKNFGRMRQFEYSDIVAAVRESFSLEVTGPEGLEEVRRKVPFDPDKRDEKEPRTVYVKGFGEELPTTQFDIEAFFAQYGPTNCVRLRRTEDKLFKGSSYVEFQDEETAKSFLALDPKPLWQGKHELDIMSMREYRKKKNKMIRDGEMEPNATRPPFRGNGRAAYRGDYRGGRDRRDGGDRDPDDWKKRRESDQKSGFRDNRGGRNRRNFSGRSDRGWGKGKGRDRYERDDGERPKPENANEEEEMMEGHLNKKRARENDATTDESPPKKLFQKEAVGEDVS